jgi:hypothetical protein
LCASCRGFLTRDMSIATAQARSATSRASGSTARSTAPSRWTKRRVLAVAGGVLVRIGNMYGRVAVGAEVCRKGTEYGRWIVTWGCNPHEAPQPCYSLRPHVVNN